MTDYTVQLFPNLFQKLKRLKEVHLKSMKKDYSQNFNPSAAYLKFLQGLMRLEKLEKISLDLSKRDSTLDKSIIFMLFEELGKKDIKEFFVHVLFQWGQHVELSELFQYKNFFQIIFKWQ